MAALANGGINERGVLTPFLPEVHNAVVTRLRASGITITADRGTGIANSRDMARLPAHVLQAETARLGADNGQTVAVVCTNVLATFGRTVVDSVLATLWHAGRKLETAVLSYAALHERIVLDNALPPRP